MGHSESRSNSLRTLRSLHQLALLVKGQQAIQAGRLAISEIRVNLAWLFFNALCVGPAIAGAVAGIRFGIKYYSLEVVDERVWLRLWAPGVFLIVLFLGDFIPTGVIASSTPLGCGLLTRPPQRHANDMADACTISSGQLCRYKLR